MHYITAYTELCYNMIWLYLLSGKYNVVVLLSLDAMKIVRLTAFNFATDDKTVILINSPFKLEWLVLRFVAEGLCNHLGKHKWSWTDSSFSVITAILRWDKTNMEIELC